MGYFGGSSTSSTSIPDATPEELEQMGTFNAISDALIQEIGYDRTSETIDEFENPARIESLQSNIARTEEQIADINARLQDTKGMSQGQVAQLRSQLSTLNNSLSSDRRALANEQDNVTQRVDVTLTRRPDPRVQSLRDQGREDEAVKMEQELEERELAQLDAEDELTTLFTDAARKYLSGDLSITPQQQAELDNSFSRIKDPVFRMLDEVEAGIGETEAGQLGEIERTKQGQFAALTSLSDRINQTGMDVDGALFELESRIKKTGVGLSAALDESVAASRALAKNGLLKQTADMRRNIAESAALQGRSDLDPRFVRELQDKTLESAERMELNLAVQEQNARLGIVERTGAGLETVQQLRANLREATGQRLEDVEEARVGIEGETGLRREGAVGSAGLRREELSAQRAGFLGELNQRRETQRMALGQGLPVQQMQAGAGALGFTSGLRQQGLANLQGAQSGPQVAAAGLRQERLAQPTTTTTQSPSTFSSFQDVLGTATDIAGGAFGAAGMLRRSGGSGGGGSSGGADPFSQFLGVV